MVRSLPATTIQLGLVLQAAVVIVAEKLSAKLNTWDRAMNTNPLMKSLRQDPRYAELLTKMHLEK